ncbi:hypothetical protein WJX72_002297 [[Myrmecia] bisecta]|uniref:Uncharacterized protein n=1 Tax=[Myrmecia] bisecta TaxID=41462 RepID=A0AAW1R5M8_9CHLO
MLQQLSWSCSGQRALMEYKDDIHELCEVAGIREDKTRYYKGVQAVEAVNTVIQFLKEAGPPAALLRWRDPKTLYADGKLPGGAYAIDLAQLGEVSSLAEQVAALLINQLTNKQGTSQLAASPSWDSLVLWLRSNDQAILIVMENAEMILLEETHIEELMQRNALLLTIIAGLINSKRCSVEVAITDTESKRPLMLLEGARMGAAHDHPQVKDADTWLLKHLTAQEKQAIARLSLFRGSISLRSTLEMVNAESENSSHLQGLMDSFVTASGTKRSTYPSQYSAFVPLSAEPVYPLPYQVAAHSSRAPPCNADRQYLAAPQHSHLRMKNSSGRGLVNFNSDYAPELAMAAAFARGESNAWLSRNWPNLFDKDQAQQDSQAHFTAVPGLLNDMGHMKRLAPSMPAHLSFADRWQGHRSPQRALCSPDPAWYCYGENKGINVSPQAPRPSHSAEASCQTRPATAWVPPGVQFLEKVATSGGRQPGCVSRPDYSPPRPSPTKGRRRKSPGPPPQCVILDGQHSVDSLTDLERLIEEQHQQLVAKGVLPVDAESGIFTADLSDLSLDHFPDRRIPFDISPSV